MVVRVPASSANLGPAFDALAVALDRHLEVSDRGDPAPETHPAVRAFRHAGGDGRCPSRRRIPGGRGPRLLGRGAGRRPARGDAQQRSERREPPAARCCATRPSSRATPTTRPPRSTAGSSRSPAGMSCASRSRRVLEVVVWIPDRETATASARRLLPDQVPFDDAVFNVGRTALLVAALAAGDVDALRVATEDRLHQDRRLARVPDTRVAIDAVLDAGACAAWLSGRDRRPRRSPTRRTRTRCGGAADDGPRAVLAIDDEGASDHVKLDGACVVVTGGAGGIGAALARRFAARRRPRASSWPTATRTRSSGRRRDRRARRSPCDVHDEDAIRGARRRDRGEHGPIDLFCSNAGVIVARRRRGVRSTMAAQPRRQRAWRTSTRRASSCPA